MAIESKGNKIFSRSKSSRAMSKRTARLMSIQEGYTQAKKAGYDRLILLLPTKDLQSSRAMSKRTARLMSIQERYTQTKKAGYDRLILLLPTKDLQNTIIRKSQCMSEDITQLGGRHSQQQYFWCHHLSYRRPTP